MKYIKHYFSGEELTYTLMKLAVVLGLGYIIWSTITYVNL